MIYTNTHQIIGTTTLENKVKIDFYDGTAILITSNTYDGKTIGVQSIELFRNKGLKAVTETTQEIPKYWSPEISQQEVAEYLKSAIIGQLKNTQEGRINIENKSIDAIIKCQYAASMLARGRAEQIRRPGGYTLTI